MGNMNNDIYKKQWLEAERNLLLMDIYNPNQNENPKEFEPDLFDCWVKDDLHLNDYIIEEPSLDISKQKS